MGRKNRDPVPIRSRGLQKDLSRLCDDEDADLQNDHECRACELYDINYREEGAKVYGCSTNPDLHPGRKDFRCKYRSCPGCAEILAQQYARNLYRAIKPMQNPRATIITLLSRNLSDLKLTISAFHRFRQELYEIDEFKKAVRSGAGCIETLLSRSEKQWAVHSHMAVDIVEEFFDIEELGEIYREITDGRGQFKPATKYYIKKAKEHHFTHYTCKHETWCPKPHEMTHTEYKALHDGLYKSRLYFSWGKKKKDK